MIRSRGKNSARVSRNLQKSIAGVTLIKAFAREEKETQKISDSIFEKKDERAVITPILQAQRSFSWESLMVIFSATSVPNVIFYSAISHLTFDVSLTNKTVRCRTPGVMKADTSIFLPQSKSCITH
jgi:ABC-type multidrug transport system fused ATPase/permease subunit